MKLRLMMVALAAALVLVAACSGGGDDGGTDTGTEETASGEDTSARADAQAAGPVALAIDCPDEIAAIYGDPGELGDEKGAILKCAADGTLTADDIRAELKAIDYAGDLVVSGAAVYRVLYRTERGNGAPGYSSALVYLPQSPPDGPLPLVVASHGSRGQAAKCAPSLDDPAAADVRDDFIAQVYPLVGRGLPVIAPDLAGYANYGAEGNPPSAYASAADVSPSTLDGARALRKLIPDRLSDKIVLLGHSQGGHTALSALALSEEYGVDGTIAAVVVFAPLWVSQRSWGGLFVLAEDYPIADVPSVNAISVWYHYTHGVLFDGPVAGLDPFHPDKRDAIEAWIGDACWTDSYPGLEALGTTITDLFDPAFVDAVYLQAGVGVPCKGEDDVKALCEQWMSYYKGDRPAISGAAAEVPVLLVYGGKDTTLWPDRFQCVLDKFETDGVNATHCFDPEGGHGNTLVRQADQWIGWVEQQVLGANFQIACPGDEIILINADSGDPEVCPSIPPND